MSPSARNIARIEEAKVDYLPGLSSDDKKQRLSQMSYEAFLRDLVHAERAVIDFYQARTKGEWGVGTDAEPALDCWAIGLPGFKGMNLANGSAPWVSRRRVMRMEDHTVCIFPTATQRSRAFW